ncbi:hypothetical protein PVAND_000193 [Polypedilum vanderplanki]|uniref:Ragulator complex protein LAMTOR1 n=1 Tax=Polypedilum vanderplanki TaxID=319348 RepID=A0A9J6BJY5_POLVA|nr:hypothetical protein PVAND_000193 [Polypedilum vanderplanki]
MEFLHSVIEAFSNCCLNCREEEARAGEATERSPLLQQQDQRNQTLQIRRISENNIDENEISTSFPTREKDEQTALSRIVQETNSNIIDVSALDTHHMLEQSEYNDRVKLYNQRLAQQWNNIPVPELGYNGLLKDMPNPEILLNFNPTTEELAIAKNFVKEAAQAINDMKIDNQDDLVVPFHFK